jgi:hypothetical protein
MAVKRTMTTPTRALSAAQGLTEDARDRRLSCRHNQADWKWEMPKGAKIIKRKPVPKMIAFLKSPLPAGP